MKRTRQLLFDVSRKLSRLCHDLKRPDTCPWLPYTCPGDTGCVCASGDVYLAFKNLVLSNELVKVELPP